MDGAEVAHQKAAGFSLAGFARMPINWFREVANDLVETDEEHDEVTSTVLLDSFQS